MKFQTAYMIDKPRVQTFNDKPSMTKQALADNADINKIIKRYNKTGVLQNMKEFEGQYGDFDSQDFQDAMNVVAEANTLFEQVPSTIRAEFKNDPGAFIDFATNPENQEQMAKWGLAKPIEPPPEINPIDVNIVNQPAE
jgi:phage internal scaffolding protein